jgi:hypothetical protein
VDDCEHEWAEYTGRGGEVAVMRARKAYTKEG